LKILINAFTIKDMSTKYPLLLGVFPYLWKPQGMGFESSRFKRTETDRAPTRCLFLPKVCYLIASQLLPPPPAFWLYTTGYTGLKLGMSPLCTFEGWDPSELSLYLVYPGLLFSALLRDEYRGYKEIAL
jgi:hypothetical protein